MGPGLRRMLDMARYFVMPEDSEFVQEERRPLSHRAAKAVFWLLVSVLAGMALGRLGQ